MGKRRIVGMISLSLAHEAVCLDSLAKRLFWPDDFEGDQLKDEWRAVGTGTAAVIDQQTGGIIRLLTGAVNGNNWILDWNDIRSLLASRRVTIEIRLKLEQATYCDMSIELRDDANDYIQIYCYDDDGSPSTWYLATVAGGAGGGSWSNTTVDALYHILRIECHTADQHFAGPHVHFYIDGVEFNNSPRTVNITAVHLQPYVLFRTKEDAAHYVDIDYVRIRQDRGHAIALGTDVVRSHEAVCLDSLAKRLDDCDDFLGQVLKDEWRSSGSVGSAAVVDQQDGGICRILTGGSNNDWWSIDWNNIRSLLIANRATLEARVKASASTFISLDIALKSNNWNDFVRFVVSEGAGGVANWQIVTSVGGVSTSLDSGVALDANYHIYRIECHTADQHHAGLHVHFYIDDDETGNSPITTNITALHLQIEFNVLTKEDVVKGGDIDYVGWRQDRGHAIALGTDAERSHEAYCLDSAQDRFNVKDDFEGQVLKDEWNSTGSAGGSAAVIDQQDGGIVRITTDTDDNDAWRIEWTIRSLLASLRITLEVRLKANSISNIAPLIYLWNAAGGNFIVIYFDTDLGHNTWRIRSANAGAYTAILDTGVAVDTNYHIFRMECHTADQHFAGVHVHFYIDGTEVNNSPITANITVGYLEPRLYLQTRENAAKSMDIDYVGVRQDR